MKGIRGIRKSQKFPEKAINGIKDCHSGQSVARTRNPALFATS